MDVARHAEECVRLLMSSEPWITLRIRPETALAALTDRAKEVYAIHDAKGVAAFIVVEMRGLVSAYIQVLCTRADCRGQGLDSTLLRWAEERIFRDSPDAFICVSPFNAGARRLYERHGFVVSGVLRELLVRGHDGILLRKSRGTWDEFRDRRCDRDSMNRR